MIIVFLILFAIAFIFLLLTAFRAVRIKKNVVVAFTGSMGSSKTYNAVKHAIKAYKRRRLMKWLGIIKQADPIQIYANMPVRLSKQRRLFGVVFIKEQWAKVLTREHILMEERLSESCVIILDEISEFASQWDFDNPNCQVLFAEWIRYCRHYFDPLLFVTAQASGEILIDLRRKLASCYNLDNFRRSFIFFYKVDVTEVQFTEEVVTVTNPHEDIESKPYFFGLIPFKYLKFLNKIFFPFTFNKYDSRCYSGNYPAINKPLREYEWEAYKTDYFIDLVATIDQMKAYKASKKGIRADFVKTYQPTATKGNESL